MFLIFFNESLENFVIYYDSDDLIFFLFVFNSLVIFIELLLGR